MALTLLSTHVLMEGGSSSTWYGRPDCLMLADGHALVTITAPGGGGVQVHLITPDGTIVDTVDVAGMLGSLAHSVTGALLFSSTIDTLTGLPTGMTVYPLTIAAGAISVGPGVVAATPHPRGVEGAASHVTPDGITWVAIWDQASAYTSTGVQIATAGTNWTNPAGWSPDPTDGTRIGMLGGDLDAPIEYHVTPSGVTATNRPDWAQANLDWVIATSGPYGAPRVVEDVSYSVDEPRIISHDGVGNVVATAAPWGWLNAPGRTMVPHRGGLVTVAEFWNMAGDNVEFRPEFILAVGDELLTVPATYGTALPAAVWGGFSLDARGGRGIATAANTDSAGGTAYTVWLLDVGGPVDGVLAIDTHDHPWHMVGTRDRSMPYELVIDTGSERLVEIVAGEESLATHELVIDEGGRLGDPWTHCALLRPYL